MSKRDDFSTLTKNKLCNRVNNKCSFPGCRAPTSGPSTESDSAVDSTGMACHIYAAAPGIGAKRYNPKMTSEERKSIKNGIWMCYKHGKQIDNDEDRFKPEVLLKWKEIAERRALLEHQLGKILDDNERPLFELGLAENSIFLSSASGSENYIIGDFLRNSCVEQIWGKRLTSYLIVYLIERTRNAFQHGGASEIKIEVEKNKITLVDNGDFFSHHDLFKSDKGRGGALSAKKLLDEFSNKILFVSERFNDKNHSIFSFVTDTDTILSTTSCAINLENKSIHSEEFSLKIFNTCSHIYIILQKYLSASDLYFFDNILPGIDHNDDRIILVTAETTDFILEGLLKIFPKARVMNLTN